MANFPIVVIGASAGGLDPLRTVFEELSPDLPAVVLAVVHIGSYEAQLPNFFRTRSALPVHYPKDGEAITPGNVYIAPPDRHLTVMPGHMHLSRGPKENFSRPAIDPLFRSAAEAYGPGVIGVILAGNLSDGTAGLWEVKRRGGIAIVQDPAEAGVPSMPLSALEHVEVDYRCRAKEIARVINRLAATALTTAIEVNSAREGLQMSYSAEEPAALVCPDCGGAVRERIIGSYLQFHCHTGHAFGENEMGLGQFEALEKSLESALRLLKERVTLCRKLAEAARKNGMPERIKAWERAGEEAESRLGALHGLLEADWMHPEEARRETGSGVENA